MDQPYNKGGNQKVTGKLESGRKQNLITYRIQYKNNKIVSIGRISFLILLAVGQGTRRVPWPEAAVNTFDTSDFKKRANRF